MAKRRTEEEPIIAAIRREVTAELPLKDRADENKVDFATFSRLALEVPELFLAYRRASHRFRDREGRAFRTLLDEIHGELWEQPPFTSDRIIIPTLNANYGEIRGRPTRGSVGRRFDTAKHEFERRQLDALTFHPNAELWNEPWHKKANYPRLDSPEAAEALLDAGLDPNSPVLEEIREAMVKERWIRYDTPFGMRVHRPQEWAAMALLRFMGQPAPIPWPDAVALIKDLTRDARP